MAAINRLSQGAPSAGASIPFYDPANGSDRRMSITELVDLIQSMLTVAGALVSQYYAPNATDWSVLVAPPTDGAGMFLLVTPAAGYAAGTITLPAVAACVDGQEVLVHCTQFVAALTVAGNGATVNGSPTALAANGCFRLRFDGVLDSWYRIG